MHGGSFLWAVHPLVGGDRPQAPLGVLDLTLQLWHCYACRLFYIYVDGAWKKGKFAVCGGASFVGSRGPLRGAPTLAKGPCSNTVFMKVNGVPSWSTHDSVGTRVWVRRRVQVCRVPPCCGVHCVKAHLQHISVVITKIGQWLSG